MSRHPFVQQVLSLRPKIAVFDCDGTLWPNNSGDDFLYWSIQQKLVSDAVAEHIRTRHEDYKRGSVDETVMCGEMTSMYSGVSNTAMDRAAAAFFDEIVAPNIFPEMLELTLALRELRVELWAVSSTNEWVIKYAVKRFGIAKERVLAAKVNCEDEVATGDLIRVPSGHGKARAIHDFVRGNVDAVFGNSIHDLDMLELAKHPFAVNPNPDLEALASERGWTIYWPEAVREQRSESATH
jgi:phosphoserine phosphatase